MAASIAASFIGDGDLPLDIPRYLEMQALRRGPVRRPRLLDRDPSTKPSTLSLDRPLHDARRAR
jgi:hypothetical protein